jgi:hypothetical protein
MTHQAWSSQPLLCHADVFVDDEILAAQGSDSQLRRIQQRQLMVHLNDLVLQPNDGLDHDTARQDPILQKSCKTLLGSWEVDTLRGTIELVPSHHRKRLQLQGHKHQRISQKKAQQLLGELRSTMSIGIPGSAGLFSLLQAALTDALRNKQRVRVTRHLAAHLQDLVTLAQDVATRPTQVAELFPRYPADVHGLTDACQTGMGGVMIFGQTELGLPPTVWQAPVPLLLQSQMITEDNPQGTLTTNSDLELATTVLQHDAILGTFPIAKARTILTGCDNTPAVAWRQKGSNSLEGPSAYLLRLAALQQRQSRSITRLAFVPGEFNVLADIASVPPL